MLKRIKALNPFFVWLGAFLMPADSMKGILIINTIKLFAKLKMLTIISLTITPLVWLLEKLTAWHMENSDYAIFVLTAVAIDHLLGSVYHAFWKRDFSIKKNLGGLLIKTMIVVSVGYLFEGLNTILEGSSFIKSYFVISLRLMVFLYPAGSAFSNSYLITNKKFPPMGFMETLKKFSDKQASSWLDSIHKNDEKK